MPQKPKFLLKKTYLAVIRGSVGSKMFRSSYFKIRGKEIEVLENGNLACAFYLTSILKIFSLVRELHTTVKETEKDLVRSGWKDIKKPKTGCVIVYAPKKFESGNIHRHLGFYLGDNKAITNHAEKGSPQIFKWNYRPVERLLWHSKLNG